MTEQNSPSPPSTGWVVHEVERARESQPHVWAWCKVQVDAPGYIEVYCTATDGSTVVDVPATDLRLGRVLFQVWC